MSRLRRAVAVAGCVTALAGVTAAHAQAPARPDGAVVVVGVPALRWQDVTAGGTPALWRLAGGAAIGSLSVRATEAVTAPADGWATLGAGNRATGRRRGEPAAAIPALPAGISVVRARNDDLPFDTEIGALGTALEAAGVPRVAFGPGAALALADAQGSVDARPLPDAAADFDTALASAVRARSVVVVEAPQLSGGSSAAGRADVDALVRRVERVLAAQDTLLVAGVSDRPGEPAQLRVAMAAGAGFPRAGGLRSALTRRDGFVQLIDLGPTVLRLAGVPRPDAMVGRPWQRTEPAAPTLQEAVARLVDADAAAAGYRRYVPPFFLLLFLAQLLLYAAAYAILRRPRAPRARVLAVTRGFALAFAAVPAATYLAHLTPWWRYPLGYLLAVVAAFDAVVYLLAARGPWRSRPLGPEGVVAGTTFAVIGVDLLTGARLQLSSLAGYSPVVAGRFAGIGNVAFAVFATGALLFAAALCVRRSARACLLIVAAVGLVAVVLDGSPLWGSDFGGVLALVPGFAVLGLLVSGRRLSWPAAAAVAAGAVAVVAAFALADYARPAEAQTHLGRFVGQLLDGGAGTIVRRKAQANLRLLTRSVLTLVVPLAVAFVTVVLLRPTGGLRRAFAAVPALRAGLLAVLVMGVAGFLSNDSGVAVPALALSVAVPLALAAAMPYVDADETAETLLDRPTGVLP